MKTFTHTLGLKGRAGKLFILTLMITALITAFVPLSGTLVYGDQASSDGAVGTPQWIVKFIDIDGTLLKEETVDDGADATPPTITAKKGYKFLGWSDWYTGVTSDRTVKAVYEMVMTTSAEENGELGDAGTAKPPAEKIAIATTGGLEVIDTSEDAITTPEIIKPNETPTTVVDGTDSTMSPTTIILIVLAALVVLAAAGYFILAFLKKRRKEEYTS